MTARSSALYTDSDVAVVQFRRVVIANGVDVVIERGDLAERSAIVDLERPQRRRPEDELAENGARVRPEVFGALLDLAAQVHHRLHPWKWSTFREWRTSRRCSPPWTTYSAPTG